MASVFEVIRALHYVQDRYPRCCLIGKDLIFTLVRQVDLKVLESLNAWR